MQGRKPNVVDFPGEAITRDEPTAEHFERAKNLRLLTDLNDSELGVFDRLAPELVRVGRLQVRYLDAFCEYCRIVRRLADAREFLDREEWQYVTSGRNGKQYKSRPQVAQLNDDWRKWRSLVGEFGLAPASDRGFSGAQADMFGDGFDNF